jgi:polyhydroxyalkanoate synthesis regulator phasin
LAGERHRADVLAARHSERCRSAANTRAQIRRILREDGMLITAERKPLAAKTPDRITLLQRRVAQLERQVLVLSLVRGK